MKILHLSDTHSAHHRLKNLPDADIVVHSGDFCMVGEEREAMDFLYWFCDLPYRHKIFICGNHDSCLYDANIDGLDGNVHYLCNSGIEIDGLKFYGVPMFTEDCISDRQTHHYAKIPADTGFADHAGREQDADRMQLCCRLIDGATAHICPDERARRMLNLLFRILEQEVTNWSD